MMFDAKLIRKSLQTREYYRFLTLYVATIGYNPIVFLHGAIPRLNLWCGEVSGHSINQLA